MEAVELFAVFFVACLISAACIPPIRRIAVLRRLLDLPDDTRRAHHRPIPRLGGIAVFVGFVAATIAGVAYQRIFGTLEPRSVAHTAQMLVACTILFTIGLVDDIRGVKPVVKLVGQTAAALIVQYKWTLLSSVLVAPVVSVLLGSLGVPIMVLWLVGVSNALNLVDGVDGLAGGVSVIALVAIAVSSLVLGGPPPIATLALAGAIVGFLRYNFPRARIFLGDSGSLVIGFLLAFLSVRRATRADGVVIAIIPLFALSYPLIDTATSMLRRWLRGHPLSRADGRHIHHQLMALGVTPARSVGIIWAFSMSVAALGLSLAFAPHAFTLGVSILAAVFIGSVIVVAVRRLQYHEFLSAGAIISTAGSLAKRAIRDSIHSRDVANLIARAESLAEIDVILGAHAETFGFAYMRIGSCNARIPDDRRRTTRKSLWKLEYPVIVPATGGFLKSGGLEESLVLTIWCEKSSGVRSASAERVAHVVADSIANWSLTATKTAEREIRVRARTPESAVETVLADIDRRTSGEHVAVQGD